MCLCAAGIVGAAAAGLLAPGVAHADVFIPLPDGQKISRGAVITRTAEHAVISPSLSANGAGRVVWVTGNVVADVSETPEGTVGPDMGPSGSPGSNNSSTSGASQINTGYIIGCQVSIGDDAISAGASGGVSLSGLNASGSIGLKLGPGQVRWVQFESAHIVEPGVYTIDYQDVEVNIEGCAGYAQARAYTNLEIIGDHYSKTTLYGMPFSLG